MIQESLFTAETTRSPLVVDLDGDGVETTTVENGVYFDQDNNGFALGCFTSSRYSIS